MKEERTDKGVMDTILEYGKQELRFHRAIAEMHLIEAQAEVDNINDFLTHADMEQVSKETVEQWRKDLVKWKKRYKIFKEYLEG